MDAIKFWIGEENRIEAIKAEFEKNYTNEKNPLTVSLALDGGYLIELSEVNNMNLLYLFHAGINFGLKKGLGMK